VADPSGVFAGGYFMDTFQNGEGCEYRTARMGLVTTTTPRLPLLRRRCRRAERLALMRCLRSSGAAGRAIARV
jgi:hypothetical protein